MRFLLLRLKDYYWEKLTFSKLRFFKSKNFIFEELQFKQISLIDCVTFYSFNFERNYGILKPKSSSFLLNKNITHFSLHTLLERRTLCLSLYKYGQLKVKLWCVGICQRKKRAFFVTFILSKEKFLTFVF